jgi:hypothetical protein
MPPSANQRTNDAKVLIGMLLVLAIPITITLMSVNTARPAVAVPADPQLNPSPYGYTWSLLLFAVPDALLAYWVLAMHRGRTEKRAFWLTLGLLVPTWCLLDIFLGLTFFKFPNHGASIGSVWGYAFDTGWRRGIPVEEFGFYVFGFIAMLLVYIWSDEYLLSAYSEKAPPPAGRASVFAQIHPQSLIAGGVLFALAWMYKAYAPHADHAGIPGYFGFILLSSVVPSLMFYRIAAPSINWRAMMVTLFFILFLSLFWEGTVGVPYQWWDYNHSQMIGIFIGAFAGLPIEAVIIWGFAAWTTIVVYETVHAFLRARAAEAIPSLPAPASGNPVTASRSS